MLRGFCWEGDGAPPYWARSQVLQAGGLPMADLGEAGRLLQPASAPAEPISAAAASDARFRLFEAVARSAPCHLESELIPASRTSVWR